MNEVSSFITGNVPKEYENDFISFEVFIIINVYLAKSRYYRKINLFLRASIISLLIEEFKMF